MKKTSIPVLLFLTVLTLGCGGHDNSVTGATAEDDPTMAGDTTDTTMGDGAESDPTLPSY